MKSHRKMGRHEKRLRLRLVYCNMSFLFLHPIKKGGRSALPIPIPMWPVYVKYIGKFSKEIEIINANWDAPLPARYFFIA